MQEIVYDLNCKGRKIIQDKDGYCFTTDSVLLANFIKLKASDNAVEFCSGSGVISVLAEAKNNVKSISLVEIQPRLAKMSERTIELNNLGDKLKVYNQSFQDFAEKNKAKFDVVFSNPPYVSKEHKNENLSQEILIARHETMMTLADLAIATSKVLRYGGKFFMVHKADRFDDILTTFWNNCLAVKKVVFCHPKLDKEASFVLFEGTRGGRKGVKVMPPLILSNSDGSISAQVNGIYNRNI